MHIVLDAMGSDDHPEPELQAAARAAAELRQMEITLVGPEEILRPRLDAFDQAAKRVHVAHAPEVLKMTDKPARNARRKPRTSMAVGLNLLDRGEADAFVTAGNTGGAMATALFTLGRVRGVRRPALTALFPVRDGHTVVLDIGANADCKPEYLLQFAVMGAVYAREVLGVQRPRIGLLSNGEEAGKGNELAREAFELLQESDLHFIGNVEGKELFHHEADVVVTDGFTGNVLLKSSEAVARLILESLREALMSSTRTQIGALLARPAFEDIRRMLDPAEVGAAPLLGIDGLVFVGHGRSDARALFNGLRVADQAASAKLLHSLSEAISEQLGRVAEREPT